MLQPTSWIATSLVLLTPAELERDVAGRLIEKALVEGHGGGRGLVRAGQR